MARYTDADCKLCRREGAKLFLKGERCVSKKCAMERRPVAPGFDKNKRSGKMSDYGKQLREKQKVKRAYGVLEKQFRGYYDKAVKARGVVGENMLSLLERRLDNVVYRLGIGASRAQARQIVNHGLVTVNGKVLNIPSYSVKKGDVVSIKESKQDVQMIKDLKGLKLATPKWLDFDSEKLVGKVLELPARDDIDLNIQEHLIVELYSR